MPLNVIAKPLSAVVLVVAATLTALVPSTALMAVVTVVEQVAL